MSKKLTLEKFADLEKTTWKISRLYPEEIDKKLNEIEEDPKVIIFKNEKLGREFSKKHI